MKGRTVSNYARAYVRGRAMAHMTSEVRISRHRDGELDTATGLYTADTGKKIYEGIARIWDSGTGAVINAGEADLVTTVTYCSVPFSAPIPRIDDLLVVTHSPSDGALLNRGFRIIAIDGGGLARATRRLQISALSENRSWRPEDAWEE